MVTCAPRKLIPALAIEAEECQREPEQWAHVHDRAGRAQCEVHLFRRLAATLPCVMMVFWPCVESPPVLGKPFPG